MLENSFINRVRRMMPQTLWLPVCMLWSLLAARHSPSNTTLRQHVCERIRSAGSQGLTHTAAKHLASVMGQRQGPRQAITAASMP